MDFYLVVFLKFIASIVPTNQPTWIADAKSRPLLQSIGQWIESKLPANPEDTILNRLRPGAGEAPAEPAPGETTPPAEPQPVAPATPPATNN